MPDPAVDLGAPVRSRDALAEGLPRRALAGPDWASPWRGVRVPVCAEITPDLRARSAALVLPPDGALGGWAAAHLLGGAEIDGLADDGRTRRPVTLYPRHRLRSRRGIHLCRSDLDEDDVVTVEGIRVTAPARTAFDLGRWSSSVRDAVVNLDQV